MIGKVIEIEKSSVKLELTITDDQKKSIINYHVAFDTDNNRVIGEIMSVKKNNAFVNLVGEIIDNKFLPGISKQPFYLAPCRIITKEELELIVGHEDIKSFNIGKLTQYNDYSVNPSINEFFSNHFAVVGNTGSGKSYGIAKIIQNLFINQQRIPKNANFFFFDVYGEYISAFQNLNSQNNQCLKVYSTDIKQFQNIDTEILKIPLWLLDIDDIALILGVEKPSQLPIVEKALKLVSIYNKSEEDVIKYKNDIISRAIVELLYSGGTPSQIRDQVFAVLTAFNTVDLNLDSKVHVPGWTRPLRQCLIIDKAGKLSEMQLVIDYLNSFIKDGLELSYPDGSYMYTLEQLSQAFEFALISEGILKSNKVYDENHMLKVRLNSLLNSNYKEFFHIDNYMTQEEYIKSLVTSKTGEKVQIVNFNISFVDDRFAKVLVKILSKQLFNYSLKIENRASFPVHIILEEAHRYVQNDSDVEILGYNIFERITKEGRKYGVILGLISQRPCEISETAISQCTNFLVFRIQHPKDLDYVRDMLPGITEEIVSKFKLLQPGKCIAFGSAFKLPLQLKLDIPIPAPLSQNINVAENWY